MTLTSNIVVCVYTLCVYCITHNLSKTLEVSDFRVIDFFGTRDETKYLRS